MRWCKLLLRPLPPDCESAGAAWLQVNPCDGAAGLSRTRVGRENQLARVWALDGARHTSENRQLAKRL